MSATGTILLVDDDPVCRQLAKDALIDADFDVVDVDCADSALEVLKEREFDVIITDIVMPGISGIELLARVKRNNPRMEVILITGYGTAETQEVADILGAVSHLHKPFTMEHLTRLTRRVIATARQAHVTSSAAQVAVDA